MLLTVCSVSLRWCIDTVLLPHPMMLPVMLSIYVSDIWYIFLHVAKFVSKYIHYLLKLDSAVKDS